MTSIKLTVYGASARAEVDGLLTSGMVGIPVTIACDGAWDGLTKAVVCRAGSIVKTILNVGNTATVAHECMVPNQTLFIGIEGRNADGTLVIPTVWARCGLICSGANADADPSTDPTLPVWAQIQRAVGNLDNLNTEAKDNLVSAINEAMTQGGGTVDPEEVWRIVGEYLASNPPTVAETDPTVPAWAKQPEKPSYTAAEVGALPDTYTPPNQTAQQVGADPAGTASSAVSQHNVDTAAHNDLRLALQGLSDRINAALDSDDTTLDQMSEVVAYIKSNKSLIDAITTSKVSVADIVDNLTTNASSKPLSAAQGVVIKTLIDALRNDKLDAAELTNAVNTALAQAKASGEFDGADGKSAYQYAQEGGFTGTEAEFAAKMAEEMPGALPNPNALTFTGAVTGSYDGSEPLIVDIPQGGGGSSGGYVDTIIADIEITEEVSTYLTSTLTSEQVKAMRNADIIYFCANLAKPSEQTGRGNLLASIYGSFYHATKFFYNDAAYKNVTPSSSAYGGDIAESISLKNSASGTYFQFIRWKNTDNQYGGEAGNSIRTTIVIPGGSVFNLSTSTVFGVGTTAKLIARRFL